MNGNSLGFRRWGKKVRPRVETRVLGLDGFVFSFVIRLGFETAAAFA